MNNTALRANMTLLRDNDAHRKFYYEMLIWRKWWMLKIRLMGTKNDISWFQKIISRNPKVEVLEMSELYQNKGTTKFYRNYIEVKKKNTK